MIDSLTRLLFEDISLLLIAEMIALAIALAIHRRRYTARSGRGVWLTLLACALFIVQSLFIVTDREQLENLVRELAAAVDQGDVAAINERFDATFQSDGRDKQTFIKDVDRWLQRWNIDEAKVAGFTIEVDNDTATATFRAFCDARNPQNTYYNTASKWQLQFVKNKDTWKVTDARPLKVGPWEMNQGGDIFRY